MLVLFCELVLRMVFRYGGHCFGLSRAVDGTTKWIPHGTFRAKAVCLLEDCAAAPVQSTSVREVCFASYRYHSNKMDNTVVSLTTQANRHHRYNLT